MEPLSQYRIARCWFCRGMIRVPARALSVFCPHCQKRASFEDLVVTGSHPGKTLMTCGDIRIEPSARLHLEVYGHRVRVLGSVRGNIVASDFVEVGPTGRILGNITAPRITVHEGALISGRCEMQRVTDTTSTSVEKPEADSATTEMEPPRPIVIASGETGVQQPRPLRRSNQGENRPSM